MPQSRRASQGTPQAAQASSAAPRRPRASKLSQQEARAQHRPGNTCSTRKRHRGDTHGEESPSKRPKKPHKQHGQTRKEPNHQVHTKGEDDEDDHDEDDYDEDDYDEDDYDEDDYDKSGDEYYEKGYDANLLGGDASEDTTIMDPTDVDLESEEDTGEGLQALSFLAESF